MKTRVLASNSMDVINIFWMLDIGMDSDVNIGTLPISELQFSVWHIFFRYWNNRCRCRMSDITDIKIDVDANLCSQFTYRFIWRILRKRPNNFKNLKMNCFIHSFLRGTTSKTSIFVCNWTQDPQGIISYFAFAWQKILSAYSDNAPIELLI